jgi:hypothetical protein
VFSWLRPLFARPPARPTAEVLLQTVRAELASGGAWEATRARRWRAALDELCASHIEVWLEHLPEVRELVTRWYAAHPFEVVWGRDSNFRVVDPLGLTTDDALVGEDMPVLQPWATLLRSFMIDVGGPHGFHHGCDLADLLRVLRDPSLSRIRSFALPRMDNYPAGEIDELMAAMVNEPCFAELEHLAINTALPLKPRHLERLAAAPWAGSLRTLDLCETMVDWSVDLPDEQRHLALRALQRFTGLTHLFLYNDIDSTADLAVLLEAPFVNLTHLALGHGPKDAAVLELLATTRSLPSLHEFCFAGGPVRTDPAWDRVLAASFPIYMHGQRVTAEYPKRT